jgi:predicted RNA-binding Zn ribbon-like protein
MARRTAAGVAAEVEPLAVDLMNTVWIDRGSVGDVLDTPLAAEEWLSAAGRRLGLRGHGVPGPGPAGPADLRVLRDALRRVAAEVTDDSRIVLPDTDFADAVAAVNRFAARAPRVAALVGDVTGLTVEERFPWMDEDVDEVILAIVAEQGIRLLGGPDRSLLRPCLGPGCLYYFLRLDGRRTWCSPHCGNRARVARHYYRHRS